ncbi:ketopantoate reductase family protein [Azospirillum sp. sgz302134]
MRIAVMGAGAVGGYFGARIAATGQAAGDAAGNVEVHFIARGRHLEAIRANGLRIDSHAAPLHLADVRATDDPARVGPVDVVLFAVKLWDTDAAAEACRPLLKADTLVIPFQNGVTSLDTLCRTLGEQHVGGGVAHIAATIAAPGVIRHTGALARLTYGELDGAPSPRLAAFHEVASKAGFEATLSRSILPAIWEKFTFLAPFSGVTGLTRQPAGVIRRVPETRALFLDAVAEVARIARVRDVDLGSDIVTRVEGLLDALVPEMKSSMLNDLERGGRLELPWLSGAVVRLGAELGVPTPVHRVIAAALAPYADGPP